MTLLGGALAARSVLSPSAAAVENPELPLTSERLLDFMGIEGTYSGKNVTEVTALGMAVGYGLYAIAIFATLLTLVMTTGMWYVENRFKHWFTERENNHSSQPPASGLSASGAPSAL